MKKKTTIILTSALSLLAAGIGFHFFQAQNGNLPSAGSDPASPPPPTVTVTNPERRSITEWDDYTGRFEAVDHVEIKARVSGYLTEIHFTDGQFVEKGSPLFTIDQRPFAAELATAEARLAEAKAGLVLAEKNEERTSKLIGTGAVSRSQNDLNVAERQSAVAAVAAAEAQVERARLELEFTEITAPISGRIDRHLVDVGNLVDANVTALTTIVSMDPIYVSFDVNQNAFLKYTRYHESGTRVSSRERANPVRIALGDESLPTLTGEMEFVANTVDRGTGTIRARAVVANPNHFLTPGLFARIDLLSREDAETLLIPDEAISTQQSERIVYVVDSEGTVDARTIEVGPLHEGKRIVRSGLTPEDLVVVNGLQRVRVGATVTAKRIGPPNEMQVALAQ